MLQGKRGLTYPFLELGLSKAIVLLEDCTGEAVRILRPCAAVRGCSRSRRAWRSHQIGFRQLERSQRQTDEGQAEAFHGINAVTVAEARYM